MKKFILLAICAICCICLIGTTYATDNGFYDQPYPHGITPIGGVSEDGCFNFVDPDGGIGWAQYKQRELVPQDKIDQIPTTELVRSLIKEKDFMNHLSGLGSDHEDWYMEVFNFTYNSFYEMLRRDDLSEALVEVYCSTSVPTKVEDKNFVVGAAIEELMVIDQEQNGLYDEDLRSKLQTAFWEKNPTRAIYSIKDLPGFVHYPGETFNIGTTDEGGTPIALITDISEEEYEDFLMQWDNGFYDQPLPHGIVQTSERNAEGWFEFTDKKGGIGAANYEQNELIPQEDIPITPTADLIRSALAIEYYPFHMAGTNLDKLDWHLESDMYCYNTIYELFRRNDLKEALFEVYESDTVPPKTKDKNFQTGAAVEMLMYVDQKRNGAYTEDDLQRLQTAFWSKNPTRQKWTIEDLPGHVYYPGHIFNHGTKRLGNQELTLIEDLTDEEYHSRSDSERVYYQLTDNEYLYGFHSTIYTKDNYPVMCLYDPYYVDPDGKVWTGFNWATQLAWKQNLIDEFGDTISIVANATPKYNCHSYAWHSTGQTNRHWVYTYSPYLNDKNVREINVFSADKGDIITYGNEEHSAIMWERNWAVFGDSIVRSKWGVLHVIAHHPDCPKYFQSYEEMRAYRIS